MAGSAADKVATKCNSGLLKGIPLWEESSHGYFNVKFTLVRTYLRAATTGSRGFKVKTYVLLEHFLASKGLYSSANIILIEAN